MMMMMMIQDSDGEKSDTDLVVDDVNNQMSPHNGDRRSTSPPLHSGSRKTPGSGGSSSAAAASSAVGMDKLPKREPDQSARERDTSSRASSGSASGKHRDVSRCTASPAVKVGFNRWRSCGVYGERVSQPIARSVGGALSGVQGQRGQNPSEAYDILIFEHP